MVKPTFSFTGFLLDSIFEGFHKSLANVFYCKSLENGEKKKKKTNVRLHLHSHIFTRIHFNSYKQGIVSNKMSFV